MKFYLLCYIQMMNFELEFTQNFTIEIFSPTQKKTKEKMNKRSKAFMLPCQLGVKPS